MEALFVATEIKRMIAASGGMLQYDDVSCAIKLYRATDERMRFC